MTAMEYAEKLIEDKEQEKTIFDNSHAKSHRELCLQKLDDRGGATGRTGRNNLRAAVVGAENTEEINRPPGKKKNRFGGKQKRTIENLAGWHDRSFRKLHEYGLSEKMLFCR